MGFHDWIVTEATPNTPEEITLTRHLVSREPDADYLLEVLGLAS